MARPSRFPILAAGVLIAALLAAYGAAGRLHEFRLARAAPTLDPGMRRHLAMDSDREWLSYARLAGTEALGAALRDLLRGVHDCDLRTFERNRRPLEAGLLRLGIAFREIHGIDAFERRARRDLALSDRLDYENRRLEKRYYEVGADTTLTPAARVEEFERLAREFLANGDSGRAVFPIIGAAYAEQDRARHGARLRAAIPLARSGGEYNMVCQMLGDLGDWHRGAGNVDSMRFCFDEGIALARRYRLSDQASRLLRFYASFYAERGLYAVALDRLSASMRLADEWAGEATRTRAQIEYASFLADHGCWDLVERCLRRLPPLLRNLSGAGHTAHRLRYRFDAGLLQARLDFASGRPEEGNRAMHQLADSVPPTAQRTGLANLYGHWSQGLENAKRPREALGACARGLAHCDSADVPDQMQQLLVRAARIEASLGRLDVARALLDSVRSIQPPSLEDWSAVRVEDDVLRARLLFLRGQRSLARRRIEQLYRAFQAHWRHADGGSLGSLAPVGAGAIRDAIHEIEQFTPERGYHFEIEWRSLTRRPRAPPAFADALGDMGSGPVGSAPRRPAGTHLVYRFAGDALVRWVADSKRIVVDTIPLSADRCMAEVRKALESLQSEPARPGRFLGPESFTRLRGLSELLIPPSLVVSPDQPTRLDITPDGPLSALPFESLPFPPIEGSPPLALTADIAYLQGCDDSRPGDTGEVVIVSNPLVPEDLAIRYAGTRQLPESEAEARDARERWPRAVLLSGPDATKGAIREHWPGASIIYVAAHHVRDPDAPFLGFVPLPAASGAPPDASILESADIRALDLTTCRLAVLATCASGAPYRSAPNPGPSLADAFLDAGAASVIRSFWDVGDVETRDFMRVFLAHWRADQPDAMTLGHARRNLMRTPQGTSPRVWAVWSAQTSLMR